MTAMTDDEKLTLMMLLTAGKRLQAAEVGEGLTGSIGSEGARAHALETLRSLERGGAARRLSGPHSPWEITEKGRIAAAILMHKQPDLRAIFIDNWDEGSETTTDPGIPSSECN